MSTLRIGNLFSRTVSQFFREPKVRREVCAIASACGGGSGGGVSTIVAGENITVDSTDPANPIISATGGTELTAGSGIRIEDGEVKLGSVDAVSGVLSEDTFLIKTYTSDPSKISLVGVTESMGVRLSSGGPSSNLSRIQLTEGGFNLTVVNEDSNDFQFIINTSGVYEGFTVVDNLVGKGIRYDVDYSTNGTQDPRWIPDYGAVQALVSSISGVEGITGVQVDNTDPVNPVINAPTWAQVTGKPTTFTPAAHNQAFTTITGVATDAQIPSLSISKITGLQSAIDDKIDTGVGATVPDTATEASGATPTKEEFDALLAELRALKAAL